jgi:hypothetical protein
MKMKTQTSRTCVTQKSSAKRKVWNHAMSTYIRKSERSDINNTIMHLKLRTTRKSQAPNQYIERNNKYQGRD